LAAAPTKGLAFTKQALHASPHNSLHQQLTLECGMMSELGRSDDYREGVAAFMEKRAPQFKGVEMAALDTGRTVAVIGSGAMGAGIAQVAAVAGYTVRLFDTRAEAVDKAIAGIASALEKLVAKERMSAADCAPPSRACRPRLRWPTWPMPAWWWRPSSRTSTPSAAVRAAGSRSWRTTAFWRPTPRRFPSPRLRPACACRAAWRHALL
jgi:hypothetical protein